MVRTPIDLFEDHAQLGFLGGMNEADPCEFALKMGGEIGVIFPVL